MDLMDKNHPFMSIMSEKGPYFSLYIYSYSFYYLRIKIKGIIIT